jgi:teichuronic acid exporter
MRREVLKAALWVFLEAVSKNVLAFGFTVVLARLLTPADFGVVAMLSLFVGIAATLAEGGLGAALIQAKLPSQADISTLFWTQLGMAAVLGLLLAASGPLLAGWFRQDLLVPLAIAYGLNLVVSAPASIHACLFRSLPEWLPWWPRCAARGPGPSTSRPSSAR